MFWCSARKFQVGTHDVRRVRAVGEVKLEMTSSAVP